MATATTVNFANVYASAKFDYTDIDFDKLPKPQRQKFLEFKDVLAQFTEEDLIFLRWRMLWKARARVKQLPPRAFEVGDKTIWMVRSGRGWGKTLVGASWLGIEACTVPSQYHVISPTQNDVRWVCFEGPSGLCSVIPPQLIVNHNKALPSLTLYNGSIIRGFAGDTPERLRGPQCAAAWCDEIASWLYPQDAWDNMMFGLRLGYMPRVCVTGTPKPSFFIRDLLRQPEVIDVVGSTYENRENLPKLFFQSVAKYEGTKIGRQELHGEVLDPEEAGFVKRSDWCMWPHDKRLPEFIYVVMSLDTAFTEETHNKKKQSNDPTACTVWGLFKRKNHLNKDTMNVMLIDAWEEMLGFPDLIKRVKKERKFLYGSTTSEPLIRAKILPVKERAGPTGKKIDLILIEDKGSGISLRQSLAAEDIITDGYNPGKLDKLGRLHVISPLFPAHRVWAVESNKRRGEFKPWADAVITQVCTYTGEGSLKHDDLLDSTTQALRLFMDKFIGALTVDRETEERTQRAIEESDRIKKQDRNPYDP